jgi:hypothetical protein
MNVRFDPESDQDRAATQHVAMGLTDSYTAVNNPIIRSPVGKLLELLRHVEAKRLGGPQIARQHGLGPGKDAACLRPGASAQSGPAFNQFSS